MTRHECPACSVSAQAEPASHRAPCTVCGARQTTSPQVNGTQAKKRVEDKPPSFLRSVLSVILDLIVL